RRIAGGWGGGAVRAAAGSSVGGSAMGGAACGSAGAAGFSTRRSQSRGPPSPVSTCFDRLVPHRAQTLEPEFTRSPHTGQVAMAKFSNDSSFSRSPRASAEAEPARPRRAAKQGQSKINVLGNDHFLGN